MAEPRPFEIGALWEEPSADEEHPELPVHVDRFSGDLRRSSSGKDASKEQSATVHLGRVPQLGASVAPSTRS